MSNPHVSLPPDPDPLDDVAAIVHDGIANGRTDHVIAAQVLAARPAPAPDTGHTASTRLARDLAGHRTPDVHNCFLMNCRDLGDEVSRLYEMAARPSPDTGLTDRDIAAGLHAIRIGCDEHGPSADDASTVHRAQVRRIREWEATRD